MASREHIARAAKVLVELSGQLHDLRDFHEFPALLHQFLKKHMPVDWLFVGIPNPRKDCPAGYDFLGHNIDLTSPWWEEYPKICQYDYLLKQILIVPERHLVYDRFIHDSRNEEHEFIKSQANRYTDTQYCLAASLHKAPGALISLSLHRTDKKHPFSEQDREFLSALLPLMSIETKNWLLYAQNNLVKQSIEELLHQHHDEAIILNHNLNVVYHDEIFLSKLQPGKGKHNTGDMPISILRWIHEEIAPQEHLPALGGPWYLKRSLANPTIELVAHLIGSRDGAKRYLLVTKNSDQRESDFSSLARIGLTEREIETLTYLPFGYTNSQIAGAMNLREITIKKHFRHIGRKLKAKRKTEILSNALLQVQELK